ncbi:unnamed protein product [Acanthoscelides obtectus]|uniref:protein-tyrosine-phosphatase n=1 Tax=Acanthoscelides obtectus TaxID=200917 RepID=A0A9P0KNB7_ACAOB|nr:unnamed protein product [Acanthoscelides obtectus]CAK1674725.1 Tyrosine-protein phosphatase 10D [Acanthoscelides obtectus]
MKLGCSFSAILCFLCFVVQVSIASYDASVTESHAYDAGHSETSESSSVESEDPTEEDTFAAPPSTVSLRQNEISDTEMPIQLSTTILPSDDTNYVTRLYFKDGTTTDLDSTIQSSTEVMGNTIEAMGTTQDSDTTERTTTESFTNGTTDTVSTTDLPFCPIDLEPEVVSIDATNISLRWLPLRDEQATYLVYLQGIGPAYDVPPYCIPAKDERQYNISENTFTCSHTFSSYKYNISVTTTTRCGTPAGGYVTETTSPMAPEAVENLNALMEDNGTTTLSWRLPCSLNGVPWHFKLSIHGHYSLNDSLEEDRSKILVVNKNMSMYNISLDLRLAFHYTTNLSLVVQDGTEGIEGSISQISFTTPDDVPGKPIFDRTDTSDRSITVTWKAPTEPTGAIQGYELTILPKSPLYPKWRDCYYDYESRTVVLSANDTRYIFTEAFPYYEYHLVLRAYSTTGYGDYVYLTANTKPSAPDDIQDVNVTVIPPTQVDYNGNAKIHFKSCYPNGNLTVRYLTISRTWPHDDDMNQTHIIDDDPYDLNLQPGYHYRFMITVENELSSKSTTWYTFEAFCGIPVVSNSMVVVRERSTEAEVTLIKGYLNESNGEILYISLILSDENVTGGYFSQWDGTHWPAVENPGVSMYYQITNDGWNPFLGTSEARFTIGSGDNVHNKPLVPGKEYFLIVRLFTADFYRNCEVVRFRTVAGYGLASGIIIGIVVGVSLAISMFAVIYFIMKKKVLPGITTSTSHTKREPKKEDMQKRFIEECKALEEDPDRLTTQFEAITRRGKEIVAEQTTSFARLSENWRKNRYVNILPYDDARVKLLIDEDDEIGSDYINASYIKGYTGKHEYIATQGPLPTTCRDFWKMVLQENVNVIVMVSQFIANKKEKCFKYFPEKGKLMIIGEDMEVACTIELNFGTYCIRSIQVRKDNVQKTVTHMQFLEWPDFGVPLGTEHMLQFCYQVRQRVDQEGGPVIVHCSAGVGRTGTFIATDILLQKANDGKQIDVFETVMELREQRTLMVQTEEQYRYIYKLIRDHLERPPNSGEDSKPTVLVSKRNCNYVSEMVENSEHIYENIPVIQDKTIAESQF